MPTNKIYKDVDFFWVAQNISMANGNAEAIIKAIELDSELFQKYEIMDYSLLLLIDIVEEGTESAESSINYLRIEDYEVQIGIIDFLQSYSSVKKLHTTINTLRADYTKNSCVPPDLYRTRFLDMVRFIFFKN